jgi:hypothetical protein
MRPEFQERHHDYVFGPNQDPRLASVAAGAIIEGMKFRIDSDAPFELRSRAVRQAYTTALTQDGLQFLSTRWTGPAQDYRQQVLIPERLQLTYFGQVGNPGPVSKPIRYPANGIIMIDVFNAGANPITNLTFFFRGVKLFPWGAVPAYTYPRKMGGLTFSYPVPILALPPSGPPRQNVPFTVKADADFVVRGGQATAPFTTGAGGSRRTLAEVGIVLKDFNGKPYSNDYVPLDILFGAGNWPATIPLGATPDFISPFGTGPATPGLFYPEIYVPKNHQLWYDVQRTDGAVNANQNEDLTVNLIGQKVFPR